MWEIVERSLISGGVSLVFSGYESKEDAEEDVKDLEADPMNDCYWYEVRQEIG